MVPRLHRTCRPGLAVLLVLSLHGRAGFAQAGPPACEPVKPSNGGSAVITVTTPAARPSAQEIKATAEAAAADASFLVPAEPMENFGAARYRIEDYADCTGGGGCYWADVDAQARRAEAALEAAVKTRKAGEKLAMVLDIDETSLSAYCEMRREDYGYVKPMFEGWVITPAASLPLPGTLRLYRRARTLGVAIFFITGRPEEQKAATAANLRAAGYESWTDLRLREGAEHTMPTAVYKSLERKKIVDQGYRLVLNVGDQWSDLNGVPRAETSVKLPNPFYYLP